MVIRLEYPSARPALGVCPAAAQASIADEKRRARELDDAARQECLVARYARLAFFREASIAYFFLEIAAPPYLAGFLRFQYSRAVSAYLALERLIFAVAFRTR
jgi:hypothetical protein